MAAINFSRLTFVSNHSVRREYTVEVKIYKQVLWMSLAYLASLYYVNPPGTSTHLKQLKHRLTLKGN